MLNQFSRTELLFGSEALAKLKKAHVAVFGIGGVGGHVVEALARSGVGSFDLIDNDTVALTNINRQIIATLDTVGQPKVEAMRQRILSINPEAEITLHQCFFLPENKDEFDFSKYDYVVDAVDTVAAKIAIVLAAKEADVPVISSMGAGNKVNPAMFEVADIYKTSIDPLARVMRQAMKKHHIKKLKVVYSKELPLLQVDELKAECHAEAPKRRALPGSNAFCPSVAGLIIASEVIKELVDWDDSNRKGVAQ
ncbi:tRNA threonylcarbamoyladenosine dehydratase [Phascolarctobacterium sp.]|uniref:tRNA threonylcarbamoyladenosine dehydratase n=1 Tax=Phascolarctobacterium sp. TaxID=2049039 RepID=UPI0025CBD608|nr:tRNA threonylcarbamoyladenosine dehydratase [Phascolarctobacterium sp.]